jgi:hypothetical protein
MFNRDFLLCVTEKTLENSMGFSYGKSMSNERKALRNPIDNDFWS